ncbi:MAG: hypothetical protein R3C44_10445 [Chloroflexota bacterium]
MKRAASPTGFRQPYRHDRWLIVPGTIQGQIVERLRQAISWENNGR